MEYQIIFDLFLGVIPFRVDKDNWGRKLAHIAVDVIDNMTSICDGCSTEADELLGVELWKIANHLMVRLLL